MAALYNRPENVEALLRMGADATSRNAYGYSPLILAAQFGHEEIAKNIILQDSGE